LFTTAAALSVVILWPLLSQYAKDYPQIQAWITTVNGGGSAADRRTGCNPTLGAGDLLGGMLGSVALIA
jgi:hypothetical protein